MQRESITHWQASCILIMFIFGSTLVFGVGTEAGQDIWISLLITIAVTIPVVSMHARIMRLLPGKDLPEMLEEQFGKIFGKLLTAVYVWYAIHLGASVLRNFTDFIQVADMPETPQLPVAILLLTAIVYVAKCGTEVFGKWAVATFFIICGIIPFTLALSISSMDFTNLLPIMNNDLKDILYSAYQQFTLPFGETVLFLSIAGSMKKGNSPYKAYLNGILCAGFLCLVILIRNVTVMGVPMMKAVYYPSYIVGKIINKGDFFARIESVISMNYLFAGITKMALCFFAAAKGLAALFNLKNYKNMLVPVCLASLVLSIISYKSVMHLFDFVQTYYPIYVAPFQLMIPLMLWLAAEIRNARKNPAGRQQKNA